MNTLAEKAESAETDLNAEIAERAEVLRSFKGLSVLCELRV